MRKFVLSLAVLALVASPALAGKYNKAVEVGQKAPEFSGIPAFNPTSGEMTSLSLADVKEPVVVVVFLGNHCPVVQAYEDRLIDFVSDYKDKGVKVLGVSVNDIEADRMPGIKEYTKDKGSNYVYGYDESQEIGHAYGATNTPQFFVLGKDRTIRYMGAMDDNMNESKVTKNLPARRGRRGAGRLRDRDRGNPSGRLRRQVQEVSPGPLRALRLLPTTARRRTHPPGVGRPCVESRRGTDGRLQMTYGKYMIHGDRSTFRKAPWKFVV